MNINADIVMAIIGTKEYELVLLRQRIMQLEAELKKHETPPEGKPVVKLVEDSVP